MCNCLLKIGKGWLHLFGVSSSAEVHSTAADVPSTGWDTSMNQGKSPDLIMVGPKPQLCPQILHANSKFDSIIFNLQWNYSLYLVRKSSSVAGAQSFPGFPPSLASLYSIQFLAPLPESWFWLGGLTISSVCFLLPKNKQKFIVSTQQICHFIWTAI